MFADFSFDPINLLWMFLLALVLLIGLPACAVYFCWRAVSRERSRRRQLSLSLNLVQKAATFPECSWGEHRVRLVLSGDRRVDDVVIASGAIKEVDRRSVVRQEDLDFDIKDIVDVEECLTNPVEENAGMDAPIRR